MLSAARLALLLLSTLAIADSPRLERRQLDFARGDKADFVKRATTTTTTLRTRSTISRVRASTTVPVVAATPALAQTTTTTTTPPPSTTTATTTRTTTATTTTPPPVTTTTTRTTTTTTPPPKTTTTTTTTTVKTTTTPVPVCAATYAGAATTIKGTGTLPRPTAFVKRSGQQLKLGSANFRIVGPNIYWLCSDENVNGGAPPDKGRVREALAIAVAMGANTIRIHTCGVSVGPNNPYNLEPSNGNFQASLWDIRDYVIFAAREYGLRVILPLTDNYNYYHGGKYSFLNFVGASTGNNGIQFYTNQNAINAYGTYIATILTHVNAYNGVSYANDPTILAWETGNELGGYMNQEAWPPAAWTVAVANQIKRYDSNHIIIDGTNGIWNYTTGASPEGLKVSTVDIVTDHGYPRKTDILSKEIGIAKAAGKGFFIGEYDWTSSHGGAALADYLAMIEGAGSYLGDMIWNVMGHDSQCCNFVQHNDGYSLYYPNGNSAADQANILQVVKHWYKVTGRAQPSKLPAVACPQPVF